MRKLYALLTFSVSVMATAQVGVNNSNPNAALDVSPSSAVAPAPTDGILIPKINVFPATNL